MVKMNKYKVKRIRKYFAMVRLTFIVLSFLSMVLGQWEFSNLGWLIVIVLYVLQDEITDFYLM